MSPDKTRAGNFFEDFRVGQHLVHATPRTVTTGDVALYQGLFGSRFALQLVRPLRTHARAAARAAGFDARLPPGVRRAPSPTSR